MSERRRVTGKEELFIYLTKAVYKQVRMEALTQRVSVSKLVEACLVLQLKSPPLVGTRIETRGKPRATPRVKFVTEPTDESEE